MSNREVQVSEALRAILDRSARDLFVSMPGKVQKVHFADGLTTIDVQPLLYDTILNSQDQPEVQVLETITDIPVMSYRTKNFFLHFPIEVGDNVLLICIDRSINELVESDGSTPISPRFTTVHQLNDCVAFPMSFSNLSPMPEMPAEEILLAHKDQAVELRIKASGDVVLKGDKIYLGADGGSKPVGDATVIDNRFTAIEAFLASHIHPTPAGPSSPAVGAPSGSPSASSKIFIDG